MNDYYYLKAVLNSFFLHLTVVYNKRIQKFIKI